MGDRLACLGADLDALAAAAERALARLDGIRLAELADAMADQELAGWGGRVDGRLLSTDAVSVFEGERIA